MTDRLHAIIPAGGAGTRLWPLSRPECPKYLLPLDGTTLLADTLERLNPLSSSRTVVTSAVMEAKVASSVPEGVRVLGEPTARNSMPAIGLAAAIVEVRHGKDAIVGSFAADHVVTNQAVFADVVSRAIAQARAGDIVTIGITPTHPATGYGYIRAGRILGEGETRTGARRVEEFVEKPDRATAERYLADGGYLWNAGMFVASCSRLLDELACAHPQMARDLRHLAHVWGTPQAASAWSLLPSIAIDHAIAEPAAAAGRVAVVEAPDMGWSDVGDFDSLAEFLPVKEGAAITGPVEPGVIDSPDAVCVTTDEDTEEIYVLGIPGAVVVRDGRRTIVTTRQQAQRVTELSALANKQEGHQ
ncbi:MAG: sugar phosphate nucleotidyltransferase [Actinomycetaceae bacterium]|nr:sugar phosphate nucleotidyltransferase [Actinomycetaceae bacterium]